MVERRSPKPDVVGSSPTGREGIMATSTKRKGEKFMYANLYVRPAQGKTFIPREYVRIERDIETKLSESTGIKNFVGCTVVEPKDDDFTPQEGKGYWYYKLENGNLAGAIKLLLASEGLQVVAEKNYGFLK